MHTYEVIIPPNFFGIELTRLFQAKSAGAAKYEYWLKMSDAYGDMTFGEFVTKVKCHKVQNLPQAIESTELHNEVEAV